MGKEEIKMTKFPQFKWAILSILLVITSCTTSLNYNPSYQGSINPIPGPQLPGRAVILTTEVDDNYVFEGNPTSFTGGASSIRIPLGLITKEIAQNTFERMFRGGVIQTRDAGLISDYSVAITPVVRNFSYAYNQLRNVGMLVTPQVDLSISVDILDTEGNILRSNTFVSGTKEGDSYFMSGNPGERINQLAHEVVTELLNQAASDVYFLLSNRES